MFRLTGKPTFIYVFFRVLVKFCQNRQHGQGVEEVKPDFEVIHAASGQHSTLLQSRHMTMLCRKLVNIVVACFLQETSRRDLPSLALLALLS